MFCYHVSSLQIFQSGTIPWILHGYHNCGIFEDDRTVILYNVCQIRLLFLHDSGYVSLAGISQQAC